MFPSANTPRPKQRLHGALQLIRSFLLLEDDYDVDWEVDWDGHLGATRAPTQMRRTPATSDHPHRIPLRIQRAARRPGAVVASEQVCLCPLPPLTGRRASVAPANQPRTHTGRPWAARM
jgi:hypothetical protein